MGLYKQGTVWYYELYVDGRRIRKSTGVTNRRVAEDIYAKMKLEIREGRYFQKDQGNKKTFKDMAEKYMAEHSIRKASGSRRRDETSLRKMLPVFGDMLLSQITPAVINKYKQQRLNEGISGASINRELSLAKHAFNIAIREWEWVKDNPFARVSMEKLPQPRIRYLTHEEFDRLYQACNETLKPIVLFSLQTGARQDNVLSLTWQQVDLHRGVITFEHTKNGERLVLPMNNTIKALFMELNKVRKIRCPYVFPNAAGTKIDASNLRKWFSEACKKAEIKDYHWHDIRHTAASWMVQNGVDLYIVQRILGHKTATMTQRYAHLAPDNLRAGLNALEVTGTAIKTAIGQGDEHRGSC